MSSVKGKATFVFWLLSALQSQYLQHAASFVKHLTSALKDGNCLIGWMRFVFSFFSTVNSRLFILDFIARDFLLLAPFWAKAHIWTMERSSAPVFDPFCCEDISAWLYGQGPTRQSYLTANLV